MARIFAAFRAFDHIPIHRMETTRMSKPNSFNPQAYWRATLTLLFTILVLWFAVSFGAGILFRDALDAISLGGYPLGFWFAQQGSIFVFVALIFWYARRMDKIDREHNVHED